MAVRPRRQNHLKCVCVGGTKCNHERHLQKVVFELDLEGWQRWSVVDDKYTPSLGKVIKA